MTIKDILNYFWEWDLVTFISLCGDAAQKLRERCLAVIAVWIARNGFDDYRFLCARENWSIWKYDE